RLLPGTRRGVLRGRPDDASLIQRPHPQGVLAARIDAERAAIRPGAHDLDETFVVVAGGDGVIECDARRQARRDLARIDRTAALLRVVVRTGAAFQEPDAIAERAEVRSERV